MLRQNSTAPPVEEIPETPFYIPATGSSTRPHWTLKHDDCFAVLDNYADIGASAGGPDGIFYCDTRHLSHLEILLNGKQPLLLGSSVRDDNSLLTVDLTNPDIYLDQKLVLPKDVLHVVRTLFLWRGTAFQRLRIQNHGDRPFGGRLALAFAGDFADLFEVRGLRRARPATATAEMAGATEVTLNYQGLDVHQRRTTLLFEPKRYPNIALELAARMDLVNWRGARLTSRSAAKSRPRVTSSPVALDIGPSASTRRGLMPGPISSVPVRRICRVRKLSPGRPSSRTCAADHGSLKMRRGQRSRSRRTPHVIARRRPAIDGCRLGCGAFSPWSHDGRRKNACRSASMTIAPATQMLTRVSNAHRSAKRVSRILFPVNARGRQQGGLDCCLLSPAGG